MKTGTYTIDDLLAIRTAALEFGEDTIAEVLQDDLDRFNAQVEDMLAMFAAPVTTLAGRQARYGTSINGDMVEIDEFGNTATTKATSGVTVGFPLKKYGFSAGFTRDYLAQRSVADIATVQVTAEKRYLTRLQREMQRALYIPTNYTFGERFVQDAVDLDVYRLLNADSKAIPEGPNGESFDGSSHTHYVANNGWDNTTLTAAVGNLTEHGHTSGVVLIINKADETAVRALAGFTAYADPRINYRNTDTPGQTLDLSNTGNRAIGIFGDAEVWVKPWGIQGYALITATQEDGKVLKYRQHHVGSMRGLRLAAELDDYPLRAENYEAYMGFGVWTRTNGVIYYAGGGAYAAPTIAA